MSIIGHKGIQVLSNINSRDDLPDFTEVESEAVWYIESGDLAPDYIAPSFWDGQQFNQWISLVDGEVLDGIPDSVVAQYNALELELSDGETMDEWPDESPNNNNIPAVGTPTYRSDGLNGNPYVEFDGSDDAFGSLEVSTTSSYSVIVISELVEKNSITVATSFRTDSDSTYLGWDGRSGENQWEMFAGSVVQGSDDTSVNVLSARFDGENSALREDGVETASGDVGSSSMTHIEIGDQVGRDLDRHWQDKIGIVEVHNVALSNAELSEREGELASLYEYLI